MVNDYSDKERGNPLPASTSLWDTVFICQQCVFSVRQPTDGMLHTTVCYTSCSASGPPRRIDPWADTTRSTGSTIR